MRRCSNSSMQLKEEFLLPSLTSCQTWWSSDPSRSHLTSLIWLCYWVKAAHRRVWQIPEPVLRVDVTGSKGGKGWVHDKGVAGRETCPCHCQPAVSLPVKLQAQGSESWELYSVLSCNISCIRTLLTMSYHACNINTGTPACQVLQEIATIARTSQDKNKC